MGSTLTTADIAIRLAAATLAGAMLGLNRDLHGKPAGLRTFAIVALGAASITLIVPLIGPPLDMAALTRTIQGLVVAVGFLGTGLIFHDAMGRKVHGLTTAACSWFSVAIGIMSGLGLWTELAVAVAICVLVLALGGRIERRVSRLFRTRQSGEPPDEDAGAG